MCASVSVCMTAVRLLTWAWLDLMMFSPMESKKHLDLCSSWILIFWARAAQSMWGSELTPSAKNTRLFCYRKIYSIVKVNRGRPRVLEAF